MVLIIVIFVRLLWSRDIITRICLRGTSFLLAFHCLFQFHVTIPLQIPRFETGTKSAFSWIELAHKISVWGSHLKHDLWQVTLSWSTFSWIELAHKISIWGSHLKYDLRQVTYRSAKKKDAPLYQLIEQVYKSILIISKEDNLKDFRKKIFNLDQSEVCISNGLEGRALQR